MYINKLNSSKRGQLEAFGLAIIVILFVLGIVFGYQFLLKQESSNVKKTYSQVEMADGILSSMLETTTNCRKLTVRELLIDSVSSPIIYCGSNTSYQFVKPIVDSIFKDSLNEWGRDYQFIVKGPTTTYTWQNGKCTENDIYESKRRVFKGNIGTVIIEMRMC